MYVCMRIFLNIICFLTPYFLLSQEPNPIFLLNSSIRIRKFHIHERLQDQIPR
jgi:hypothetical protein